MTVLLLLLIMIIYTRSEDTPGGDFSGFYKPNLDYTVEFYGGSWLAPRQRFLLSKDRMLGIQSLEGATFFMLEKGLSLMSRDYFDFEVIHLSSTTNQLPQHSTDKFFNELLNKMVTSTEMITKETKDIVSNNKRPDDIRLTKQTLCIIPFSTNPVSNDHHKKLQNDIRLLYFQSTFWSVYRNIPNIVVSVATNRDFEILKSFNLPIWQIIDLSSIFNKTTTHKDGERKTHMLPKETLLFIHDRFKERTEPYLQFQYIFYTEGDHILHWRSHKYFYDTLDSSGGRFCIVPHRMQTIAHPKVFPNLVHEWDTQFVNKLKATNIITEKYTIPTGSCCDNGRFVFKDCGNWWYNCKQWGLSNFTDWIRFGEKGYSLPLGTEHQGRCKYNNQKIMCDLPSDCHNRVPLGRKEVCNEIPNVEKTYTG